MRPVGVGDSGVSLRGRDVHWRRVAVAGGCGTIALPCLEARCRPGSWPLTTCLQTMVVLQDGKIHLWESIGYIVVYVLYVVVVIVGRKIYQGRKKKTTADPLAEKMKAAKKEEMKPVHPHIAHSLRGVCCCTSSLAATTCRASIRPSPARGRHSIVWVSAPRSPLAVIPSHNHCVAQRGWTFPKAWALLPLCPPCSARTITQRLSSTPPPRNSPPVRVPGSARHAQHSPPPVGSN